MPLVLFMGIVNFKYFYQQMPEGQTNLQGTFDLNLMMQLRVVHAPFMLELWEVLLWTSQTSYLLMTVLYLIFARKAVYQI